MKSAWDNQTWHELGAVSVDLALELPPGAPLSNLSVDIGAANNQPARICRAELSFAGYSLPCALGFASEINQGVSDYKSVDTVELDNRAKINLGSVCADIYNPANITERSIILNVVVEQPIGLETIVEKPDTVLVPGTGLISAEVTSVRSSVPETLFTGSVSYPMLQSTFAQPFVAINGSYPTLTASVFPSNPEPSSTAAVYFDIQTPPQSMLGLKLSIFSADTVLCKALIVANGREAMGPASGPNPINTIRAMQTVQIQSSAVTYSTKRMQANLTSLDGAVTYASLDVPIVIGAASTQSTPVETNITMSLEIAYSRLDEGSSTDVTPTVLKVIYIDILTHSNMLKGLKLMSKIDVPDAASMCSLQILHVGSKLPCVLPDSATLDFGTVCNQDIPIPDTSSAIEESKIRVALGFVPNKNLPAGTNFTIRNTLTVSTKYERAQNSDTLPGEEYNLTLRFSGLVSGGRAAVLVTNARITKRGRNMFCCGSGNFNSSITYLQTVNPSQNDTLKLDLGIVSNPGYSYTRGDYQDEDNVFVVEIEVEPVDHPLAHHGSLLPVTLKVISGFHRGKSQELKFIFLGTGKFQLDVNGMQNAENATQNVQVFRSGFEFMNVQLKSRYPNPNVPSQVSIGFTLSHTSLSKIEPVDVGIRYFLPSYMLFNYSYTYNSTRTPTVTFNDGILEFKFPYLLLNEKISVDFQLVADPENIRGFGAGNGDTLVPFEAYGSLIRRFGLPNQENGVYPENGVDVIPLSPLKNIKFVVYNEGWQAEIREGKFIQWLSIDFGKRKRITRLQFALPAGTIAPKILTIETSFTGSSWQMIRYGTLKISDGEPWPVTWTLLEPFHGRFMRVRIVRTQDGPLVPQTVGLFVRAFGCDHRGFVYLPQNLTTCEFSPLARTATDPLLNRHFAVDTKTDRAFYCDRLVNSQEMRCYASSPAKNEWRLLPLTLTSVRGYQPSTGRIYLMDRSHRAVVHTVNGGENVSPTGMDEFVALQAKTTDFVPSKVIPAKDKAGVLAEKIGNWIADYIGLRYGTEYFVKWSACCV
ncbi:unnamed protein product [Notodromas monacha]|uniref:F5/8 type C domain-containing protein n=1 Tax=Notodromas monacha TaxID=399045 RepID=A0A7R9BSF0_9CRUS|nr:unnamed protein product [Notodromas monacha]CAG0919460.1 unnamed protein product [Notodromas monacha]